MRSSREEGKQTRRLGTVASIVLAGGLACLNSHEPAGFVFQYQIGVYGCGTDCTAPGAAPLSSAARGDTIWLRHDIVLLQSVDSTKRATLRPDCTENVLVQVQLGSTTVDTIPTPSCRRDSTSFRDFARGTGITRYNQWIVDSALTPAIYSIVGRVLVNPRIEPRFGFTIQ